MRTLPTTAAFVAVSITGCGPNNCTGAEERMLPESNRDKHGYIASAGYLWCEHNSQGERPWELAVKEGFEDTAEQFKLYCSSSFGTSVVISTDDARHTDSYLG